MNHQECPLCSGTQIHHYFSDDRRGSRQCGACRLVFVPENQFVSSSEEKAIYDLHQNFSNDWRYRDFLNRLLIPLQQRLQPGQRGLDFGSGPGPTLSVMFEEAGYTMRIYDCFYATDHSVFEQQYDFITSTETIEHLHDSGKELDRLWALLKPSGHLGVITTLLVDHDTFAQWHYKNDPTHVCFFSQHTFSALATHWQAQIDFLTDDLVIFTRTSGE